jgi:hypothetical protein
MMKRVLMIAVMISLVSGISAQVITISSEMRISRATKFKKAVYKIEASSDSTKAVVNIEGNNIV